MKISINELKELLEILESNDKDKVIESCLNEFKKNEVELKNESINRIFFVGAGGEITDKNNKLELENKKLNQVVSDKAEAIRKLQQSNKELMLESNRTEVLATRLQAENDNLKIELSEATNLLNDCVINITALETNEKFLNEKNQRLVKENRDLKDQINHDSEMKVKIKKVFKSLNKEKEEGSTYVHINILEKIRECI